MPIVIGLWLLPERALLAGLKVPDVLVLVDARRHCSDSLRVLASLSRLLPRRGIRLTPKALTLLEHCTASSAVQPNV